MIPLPDIRQKAGYDCGRAMLEAFHVFWDRPLPSRLAALSNPVQGLGPDVMDAALRASGFSVLSGSLTVEMLKVVTGQGYPIACLIQYEGVGHWTLVGGIQRRRITYLCPIRGIVSEPVSRWTLNWTDCHMLGGEYRKWGCCPHP
jgi:hypothetical protein